MVSAIVVVHHVKNAMIVRIVSHVNKIITFIKHFVWSIAQKVCGVIHIIEHVNINVIYHIEILITRFVWQNVIIIIELMDNVWISAKILGYNKLLI